uniref:S100/CaBP-9k-type calcium binding subdomain domain-containing protein n=1 Tax=Spermophilus dauricus TaxID=99837 RepID=A0A8C9P729_SPEDA
AKISSPPMTERQAHQVPASCFSEVLWTDHDNGKVSKEEFLSFVTGCFPRNQKDPSVLDCMMKKLNLSCDGPLDFQEFCNLIGDITVACHDSIMAGHSASKAEECLGIASRPTHCVQPPNLHFSSLPTHNLSPAHPPPHTGHSSWWQ